MANHSIAQAKNRFSELIDRAMAGESVVITRHGQPVVEFNPVKPPPRPITQADIEWLDRHRVPCKPGGPDAGELVSRMRDEDWR